MSKSDNRNREQDDNKQIRKILKISSPIIISFCLVIFVDMFGPPIYRTERILDIVPLYKRDSETGREYRYHADRLYTYSRNYVDIDQKKMNLLRVNDMIEIGNSTLLGKTKYVKAKAFEKPVLADNSPYTTVVIFYFALFIVGLVGYRKTNYNGSINIITAQGFFVFATIIVFLLT